MRNPQTGKLDFLKDDGGNVVKSRLNESLLRQLSTDTGAFYLPMQGADTIERLYASGLAGLTPSRVENQMTKRYIEQFQWPLASPSCFCSSRFCCRKSSPGRKRPNAPQQPSRCSCFIDQMPAPARLKRGDRWTAATTPAHSIPTSSCFQKLTTTPRSGAPALQRRHRRLQAKEYDKAEANFRKALNVPEHPCPFSNVRFITSATRCFGSARKPRIRMIKSSSGPER